MSSEDFVELRLYFFRVVKYCIYLFHCYHKTDDEALQIGMMQSMSEPTFHAHDEELQLALQTEEIELSR